MANDQNETVLWVNAYVTAKGEQLDLGHAHRRREDAEGNRYYTTGETQLLKVTTRFGRIISVEVDP